MRMGRADGVPHMVGGFSFGSPVTRFHRRRRSRVTQDVGIVNGLPERVALLGQR